MNTYPTLASGPPRHRLFAIEYHGPMCRSHHKGRFFKKPEQSDLATYGAVEDMWSRMQPACIPDDAIPRGDETDRLHRWGYRYYRQMFKSLVLQAVAD